MPNPTQPAVSRGRGETREAAELRALKLAHPELASAVDLQLALLESERRVHQRIPLPWLEITRDRVLRHLQEARPLFGFEDIPIDLTDLRLMVRQTADVLRQFDAMEPADYARIQRAGRDIQLLTHAAAWYRRTAERGLGAPAGVAHAPIEMPDSDSVLDQVLALAMRPFLTRCAEVLQPRPELPLWTHGHCPLCGGEPDFAVITAAAERHLICGRCTLEWNFAALTCPYCRNAERTKITSFATPDGQYRVYACDLCLRYLKVYDARRAPRPVMPSVDAIATLPLDAAAIQRGYEG